MTEFLLNNMWAVWLIVAVALVIVEMLTTSLVSIWFVPGAIVSALLSTFVKNITVQVVVFLVLAGVAIFLSKKVFRRTRAEQLTNPNELLIGKTAVVQESTSPLEARVLVGGVYWRAISDTPLKEGELVKVTAVNGNVLTVDIQSETVKEN